MKKLKEIHLCDYVLLVMLGFLLACIGYINFAGYPSFYNFDMYSDILYAIEAWEHRSVFPEGWVFGNQVYVAATPVLAALFYGITAEPLFSMGLASSVMALLVIFSFYWMIKPCFSQLSPRLFACSVLILFPLLFGDAVYAFNGWQLLYTMCSYYACYAITVFWAFGMYIRYQNRDQVENRFSLILLCCFSFFMGMQSLRQTAIMTLPMMVMECIRLLHSYLRKKKLIHASSVITILVAVSNFAGVVCSKILPIHTSPIFGEFELTGFTAGNLIDAFLTLVQLFGSKKQFLFVVLLCACGIGIMVHRDRKSKYESNALLFSLMLLSIGAIGMIDVVSTMDVRFIYYFMAYPMAAYLISFLLTLRNKISRILIRPLLVVMLVLAVLLSWHGGIHSVVQNLDMQEESGYEAVSDYLSTSGYETVFAGTDLGFKIGVASDMELRVGFWFTAKPFTEVRYLCDPEVFDAEPGSCVYAFKGEDRVRDAREKLIEYDLKMDLLKYFPECDVYVFTSEERLVDLIE